jgi:hypothetical protein
VSSLNSSSIMERFRKRHILKDIDKLDGKHECPQRKVTRKANADASLSLSRSSLTAGAGAFCLTQAAMLLQAMAPIRAADVQACKLPCKCTTVSFWEWLCLSVYILVYTFIRARRE